jgi:hypothetical protein
MKLYRREFVRDLRRQAKREVRSRPEWRREARRLPGRWNRHRGLDGLRWILPLLWLGLTALPLPGHVLWGMLIFWGCLMTFNRAGQFQLYCTHYHEIRALVQYPVTTREVWAYVAARIFRTSCWWLADLLVVLLFYAYLKHAPLVVWLAVAPLAVLAWASVWAGAIVLCWKFPRAQFRMYSAGVWIMTIFGIVSTKETGILSAEHMESVHWFLAWATPPGWAVQVIEWGLGVEHQFPVAAAGLLAFIVAFAVPCFRAMAGRFVFWQLEEKPGTQPPEDTAEEHAAQAQVRESHKSEIEARIGEGGFLQPALRSRRGWLDRVILRFCRRQEVLVDFLLGNSRPWSRPYVIGLATILLAPIAARLAGTWSATLSAWVLGVAIFSGLARTTPLFGGSWPGFALGPMKPRFVAFFALLPVGVPELRRCYLRINGLRFLAALPCWLVAGFWISPALAVAPLTGLYFAGCAWLGLLLFQPYFFVFKISPGTNDTSSGCLNLLVFLFLAVLPFTAVLATLFSILHSWPWVWQMVCFVVLGLTTFGFEAAYGRMYCGRRFDLLAVRFR